MSGLTVEKSLPKRKRGGKKGRKKKRGQWEIAGLVLTVVFLLTQRIITQTQLKGNC